MKQTLTGPVIAGVLAVVVILLAVFGYRYLVGPKQGEKPKLTDPHISQMYSGRDLSNTSKTGP